MSQIRKTPDEAQCLRYKKGCHYGKAQTSDPKTQSPN